MLARSRRADGAFVYAVTSTGIYCRPSCPARRPHRAHVVFFRLPADAEQAGYRACRRCHPQQAAGTPVMQAIDAARAYLDAHLDERVTLERLSTVAGLSPSHLQRTFKRYVGLSPKAYQDAQRLAAFKERAQDAGSVLEAAFEAGYGSSRGLYEQATTGLGMTPGQYRRGGAGRRIHFTTRPSPLGQVLVAATDLGLCAVALGDDAVALERALAEEFPNAATIARDDAGLQPWADAIAAYLSGTRRQLDLPVDLAGTAFQQRVWQALRAIPYGETRSYSELAALLEQPTATRAVAQACARNRIALVIPCHRVVRKAGTLGGYRWDPARKRRLLEMERRGA